jgi:putative MATE family efflux protein
MSTLATADVSTKLEVSYRQVWQLAYPIMLGAVAHNVINVTNTAFLSRYGEVELDASVIGGVLYFTLVFMGAALANGTQILIARRAGEGREKEIGHILDQSIYILGAVGICFFLLLQFVVPPLFRVFLTHADVADSAASYLHIRAFEIFSGMFFWGFRSFYTGIGQTRIIIYATAVMASVNILLDYTLIFGHFGFPELGIRGAAFASLTAEACAVAVFVFYAFYKKYNERFRLFRFPKIDWEQIRQTLTLAGPLVFQNLISMSAWLFFFLVIEARGKTELAAANLVRSLYMVFMIPAWGFGTAANTLVSNVIGQGKQNRVGMAVQYVMNMAIALSFALALVLAFLPGTLLQILYAASPTEVELAKPWAYIVAPSVVMCAAAIVTLNAVTGTGATKFSFRLEIVNIFVYVAFVIITGKVLMAPTTVIWFCEPLYWTIMIIACSWYLRSGRWRKLQL